MVLSSIFRSGEKLATPREGSTSMVIVGIVFIILGFLISLTIVGAIIGIPLMMLGVLFCVLGAFRRRTVINNVITVAGPSPAPPQYYPRQPLFAPDSDTGRIGPASASGVEGQRDS